MLMKTLIRMSMLGIIVVSCSGQSLAATDSSAMEPNGLSMANSQGLEQFKAGRKALFQGDYKKAMDLLKKAADADKTKISYRLAFARACYYAKNEKEARKLLTGILKTTPDHIEAGQLLAQIYTKQKNFKEVVALLEPLLKYRHDYATYHLLAEAKYNLGDSDSARKYFEEAVKLNPKNGLDRYQLGNIYLARNFFALAAESYQSALRLGIDIPVLHYKLGSAYFNLRNYFGKISQITVKAGKPGTVYSGWYLIEPVPGKKDVFRAAPQTSAVYQVAKAIEGGLGDSPDIKFLLANIYLNAKRYAQSHEMLGKIEKVIPKEDKALFYYYYAQSAFGIGQYDKYLKSLQKAIKLDETTYGSALVDAYMKVANRYNQLGQLDKYIEYLAKAVYQNPETASIHLKLGYAYEESRQYAKATVQWQMVLDLEPDNPNRMKLLNLIEKYKIRPKDA